MNPATAAPVESSHLDLTGLPDDVVRAVRDIVAATRRMQAAGPAASTNAERPPLRGRFAHLKLDLPESDFEEARKEMSRNFPREFPGEELP